MDTWRPSGATVGGHDLVAMDKWRNVRNELERMHLVTMETAEGRVDQRTTTTPGQAEILAKLDIAEPGRYLDFELPTPSA